MDFELILICIMQNFLMHIIQDQDSQVEILMLSFLPTLRDLQNRDQSGKLLVHLLLIQFLFSSIEAGSGGTPTNQVTVTTVTDHNLSAGTPIKISGVDPEDYNISTKVQLVDADNPRVFTYLLPTFRKNLPTPGTASGAEVTIETDTVIWCFSLHL